MTTLGSIDKVEQNITKAPVKAVRALHRMVYGQEGNRQNRKRLRQFKGFTFDVDTDEYRNKILTFENLQNDLVTVYTLLCLDYTGEKADLASRIIDGLRDLEIIREAARKEDDEEEDDDDEDDDFEDNNDGNETENNRQSDNIGEQPPTKRADCQFAFHFRDIENRYQMV